MAGYESRMVTWRSSAAMTAQVRTRARLRAGQNEGACMKIIDTHQHLWDLDLFSYSWCKDNPRLNRSFRMQDYLEATRGLDLAKSVHLEADVDEAHMLGETKYILSLADKDNHLEGDVACLRKTEVNFITMYV